MASDPSNILGKVVRSSTWIAKIQNPQSLDFIKTILIFFVQNPVVTQLLLLCVPSLCQCLCQSVCQTSDLILSDKSLIAEEYNQIKSVIFYFIDLFIFWGNPGLTRPRWTGTQSTTSQGRNARPAWWFLVRTKPSQSVSLITDHQARGWN